MSLDYSDTLQPRRNAMQTFFAEQFQKTLRALDDTGPNQGRIVVAAPRAGIAVALRRLSKALYKKVVLDLFPRIGLWLSPSDAMIFLEHALRAARTGTRSARQKPSGRTRAPSNSPE